MGKNKNKKIKENKNIKSKKVSKKVGKYLSSDESDEGFNIEEIDDIQGEDELDFEDYLQFEDDDEEFSIEGEDEEEDGLDIDGEDEVELEGEDDEELEAEDEIEEEESEEEDNLSSKKALEKHEAELQDIIANDPEFAEFLKEEDTDLLNFGLEEGEEEELEGDKRIQVTQEMIESAVKVFEDKKAMKGDIKKATTFAVKAFIACLKRVTPNSPESSYIIKTDDVFDRVIRMAFTYLSSAFLALLEPIEESKSDKDMDEIEDNDEDKESIKDEKDNDEEKKKNKPRFKYWKKYYLIIKQFCNALNLFLTEISSDNILNACLRTVLDNSSIFVQLNKICNYLIKNLVRIWSRRAHESRCLAFVILCKIIRFDSSYFPITYKSCYVAYVANTKVVATTSLPVIAFMQKSFSELTYLDPNIAYQYAFVYIRQCAIHLRNAMIAKRKDLLKNVYNWQYINCLYLWSQVVSVINTRRAASISGSRWFRELIHPLVQVIYGVMKVFNVPRFAPLRIHCVKMLLKIQMNCNIYIPTLSLAVDLLSDLKQIDSKKPKKAKGTAKTADMKELIKFNVEMLEDGTFRDRLATEIRSIIIEATYVNRASVAFPDIFIPIQQQFRKFIKEYKNPNILPLMKETFNIVKEHADKVKVLLNRKGIDLSNMKDVIDFGNNVEKSIDSLIKMRELLKKRIATHIIPKEQVSKKSLDKEISELFDKNFSSEGAKMNKKLMKNMKNNNKNKFNQNKGGKGKKASLHGVKKKVPFKKVIKNKKK